MPSGDFVETLLESTGISTEKPNEKIVAMLRSLADDIEKEDRKILGACAGIYLEDGNVGTAYEGDHFTGLLGAVSILRSRIERHFE